MSWKHTATKNLQMEIEIPVNSSAEVVLPVAANQTVYESVKKISEDAAIKILLKQPNQLRLAVASGKYVFEIREK